MACEGCGSNTNRSYQLPVTPCTGDCSSSYDATCINYSGPALTCLDVDTNTDLQTIIQMIDAAVCQNQNIDWESFDYSCLTDGGYVINSAQSFAERISALHCALRDEYDTFVDETYADAIAGLQDQITDIIDQDLTIACASVTSSDNLSTVLTKIGTKLCSIDSEIDPSGANWDQCYTVVTPPSNITDAFDLVIDWICDLKSEVEDLNVALPTFNNSETCITGGTSADSLYDTVVAIRDILCGKPDFDVDSIEYGCVSESVGETLQTLVQEIINTLSALKEVSIVSVDETQFTLTPIDSENACGGFELSLAEDLAPSDRLVAATSEDEDPGTLQEKLAAGDNIEIDYEVNAGQATISVTGITNDKVAASGTDDTPGFLINKINHVEDTTGSIAFTQVYNSGTKKVDVTATLDKVALWTALLEELSENTEVQALWCEAVNSFACSTTTTTTTTKSLSIHIEAVEEAMTDPYVHPAITVSQTSPTLALYSGESIVNSGDVINTGSYGLTSSASNVLGAVSIQNVEDPLDEIMTYHVYVLDGDGNLVPTATEQTGSLNPGDITTINPFAFGVTYPCVLHIDLGNVPFSAFTTTTTTSSSTTTTTTTLG